MDKERSVKQRTPAWERSLELPMTTDLQKPAKLTYSVDNYRNAHAAPLFLLHRACVDGPR